MQSEPLIADEPAPEPADPPAMPDGPIAHACVWTGAELAGHEDWIVHLSADETAEIADAVAKARARGLALEDLTADRFVLPRLAPRLAELRRTLIDGRGFALLRGLDITGWEKRDAACAFMGVGAHLGSPRSQNARGHLLGHVCDLGDDARSNPDTRAYRGAGRMNFHTDSVDIVGLFCWRAARRGGESRLVSVAALYNRILERRPDLAAELFRPIWRDRRGEVPAGKPPWWVMPVLQWRNGRLHCHFSGLYIRSAQRFEGVPRLSRAQEEMLDLVEAVAEEPGVRHEMVFRQGDMQFLSNHDVLHGRCDYEDWPEPERKRYLFRLWLCPPDGRPLPESFADRYGSVTVGDRGGIICPDTRLSAPLEPA